MNTQERLAKLEKSLETASRELESVKSGISTADSTQAKTPYSAIDVVGALIVVVIAIALFGFGIVGVSHLVGFGLAKGCESAGICQRAE